MFFEKLGSAHLAFAWLPVMTRLIDGATAWAQCLEFTHEGSIMMYYDLGISKKIINISIVNQEVCMSLQGVAVGFFFFFHFLSHDEFLFFLLMFVHLSFFSLFYFCHGIFYRDEKLMKQEAEISLSVSLSCFSTHAQFPSFTFFIFIFECMYFHFRGIYDH